MAKAVFLLGSGGHARVVIDIALASGWDVVACVGREIAPTYRGVASHAGDEMIESLARQDLHGFVAVGDNTVRLRLGDELSRQGVELATIVAPDASVSPTAHIGVGAVLMSHVVVNSLAHVGDLAIVNTAASIDHDCRLGTASHVGPGAHLAGGVLVGNGAFLGAGVTVIPGIRIGARAVVGSGATVIRDVPDGVVVYGVPARASRTQ